MNSNKLDQINVYDDEIKDLIECYYNNFKMLDEAQRKEYLINQYEEFLKKIDSIELLNRIRAFRKLYILELDENEIEKAINSVLMWDNRFIYIPNLGVYPEGTKFFRVRKIYSNKIPNPSFLSCRDFWEPPKDCVKSKGRLNKEGESLLYVTPEDPTVPIKELKVQNENYFALIRYKSREKIKVNIIGGIYDYDSLKITDEKAIINNELINDFLNDEFTREVGIGTEYLYKTSEVIAKTYFDLPPDVTQDAWAYRSVHDKNRYNVCFRPELAHKKLELEGAMICKLDNNIMVHYIVLYSEKEDKVYYYPIGSEEQKRVFPEIQN